MKTFSSTPDIEELFYAVREYYFDLKNQLKIAQQNHPEKEFKKINLWRYSAEQYLKYLPSDENIHTFLSKLSKFKKYLKNKKEKNKIPELQFPE